MCIWANKADGCDWCLWSQWRVCCSALFQFSLLVDSIYSTTQCIFSYFTQILRSLLSLWHSGYLRLLRSDMNALTWQRRSKIKEISQVILTERSHPWDSIPLMTKTLSILLYLCLTLQNSVYREWEMKDRQDQSVNLTRLLHCPDNVELHTQQAHALKHLQLLFWWKISDTCPHLRSMRVASQERAKSQPTCRLVFQEAISLSLKRDLVRSEIQCMWMPHLTDWMQLKLRAQTNKI